MTYKHEIHKFDIQTETGYLETAMHLAFGRDLCKAWQMIPATDDGPAKLILYKYWDEDMVGQDPSDYKNVYPLPQAMNSSLMTRMVKNWLDSTDYGPEPRTDGGTDKGFRLYNEEWGFVNGDWRAFAAIEPVWRVHGK